MNPGLQKHSFRTGSKVAKGEQGWQSPSAVVLALGWQTHCCLEESQELNLLQATHFPSSRWVFSGQDAAQIMLPDSLISCRKPTLHLHPFSSTEYYWFLAGSQKPSLAIHVSPNLTRPILHSHLPVATSYYFVTGHKKHWTSPLYECNFPLYWAHIAESTQVFFSNSFATSEDDSTLVAVYCLYLSI